MKPVTCNKHRQSSKTPPRQLPVIPVNPLPPLYALWMTELLDGPIPAESDATCDDCVMLSPTAPHGSTSFFNPQTKCCAFVPTLPNFLVGRLLADGELAAAKGRATVIKRLQAGLNVTPFGLESSPVFKQLYGAPVFGRSQTLRCPHYLAEEGGLCGVWRNRNAICSTWFCKHVRGAVGLSFWESLRDLLHAVEDDLARWCLLKLEVGNTVLAQLFPPLGSMRANQRLDVSQVDGILDREQQQVVWGEWLGREEEFFKACAQLVNALTWSEVVAVCGPKVQAHAQLTVEAYRKLIADHLPARLKVGDFKIIQMDAEQCRVISYSGYDPMDLSQRLLRVLGYFDGRPTAAVRQAILEQEQLKLNDALLRRLVDYGVLVSGD